MGNPNRLVTVTVKAELEILYQEDEVVSPSTQAIIDFTEKVIKTLDIDFSVKKIDTKEHWRNDDDE